MGVGVLFFTLCQGNEADAEGVSTGCRPRNSISTLRMSLQRRRTTGQSSLVFRWTELLFAQFFFISAFARIENHYFVNDAFMRDGQLLDSQEIDKMCVRARFKKSLTEPPRSRHIPTIVVQGRYDVVCPVSPKSPLPFLRLSPLSVMLPSADNCMGIEEGVARDYSAPRSRCGSFLS